MLKHKCLRAVKDLRVAFSVGPPGVAVIMRPKVAARANSEKGSTGNVQQEHSEDEISSLHTGVDMTVPF